MRHGRNFKAMRELVECAIARGQTSTRFLMLAYGLTYQDVWQIKQGMEDEKPRQVRKPPTPRIVPGHGTHAGFNRHRANSEEPCGDCWGGEREYQRNRVRRRTPRRPPSTGHGTHAGYMRHLRSGEEACDACLTGERVHQRAKYRKAKRVAAA